MPAKRMKKRPSGDEVKEPKASGPSLLDQILNVFKKKESAPLPRRPRYDDSIPPP